MTVLGAKNADNTNGGSILLSGFNYVIPEGKKLNVTLQGGGAANGMIYGWYIGGELQDA